jgi:hypothetical protein
LLNGLSWSELVVFAGTVFQQILVWAPASLEQDTGNSPVLHTLKGHDVCHNLLFFKELIKICSNNTYWLYLSNVQFTAKIS